jgi:hypothetical protein
MAKKTASVKIRLDPEEKSSFQKAAKFAGLSFSAWLRERLLRTARLELEEAGEKAPISSPPPEVHSDNSLQPGVLQNAVEKTFNCPAQSVEAVHLREALQGKAEWERTVFVFALAGHPQAKKCYAWSSSPEGSAQIRHYVALHIPPIDSPEKAVIAALLQEQKMKSGPKE